MTAIASATELRVADETWIATALLHREHPEREDFTEHEIVARSRKENILGSLRPGVSVHVNAHCVANRPPSPAGLRMLYETRRGMRRLYRESDQPHPDRHGKIVPKRDDIPTPYRYLLDWYEVEYARAGKEGWLSGIFEMVGAGKEVFAGEDPDEYVRRLREGWE
jgi:hypothetical protein